MAVGVYTGDSLYTPAGT